MPFYSRMVSDFKDKYDHEGSVYNIISYLSFKINTM